MAERKAVGRVFIRVMPDSSDFSRQLKEDLEKIRQRVKLAIRIELDKTSVKDFKLDVEKVVKELSGHTVKIGVDLDLGDAAAAEELLNTVARDRISKIRIEVDNASLIRARSALSSFSSRRVGGVGGGGGGVNANGSVDEAEAFARARFREASDLQGQAMLYERRLAALKEAFAAERAVERRHLADQKAANDAIRDQAKADLADRKADHEAHLEDLKQLNREELEDQKRANRLERDEANRRDREERKRDDDRARRRKGILKVIGGITLGGPIKAFQGANKAVTGFEKALGKVDKALGKSLFQFAKWGTIITQSIQGLGGLVAATVSLSGLLLTLPAIALAAGAVFGVLALGLTNLKGATGPAAQVRDTIKGLKDELQSLRKVVQDNLFKDLAKPIKDLATTYLPVLKTALGGIAKELNFGTRELLTFLKAPQTVADTKTGLANTTTAMHTLALATQPVWQGFRDIAVVGSEFLPRMAAAVLKVAEAFAKWAENTRASGHMAEIIEGAIATAKTLFRVLGNIGGVFSSLFGAAGAGFSEGGAGPLATIEKITAALEALFKTEGVQKGLVALFSGFDQVIGGVLGTLGLVLPGVMNAMAPVFTALGGAASTILTTAINTLAPIITALAPSVTAFLTKAGEIFGPLIAHAGPALQAIGQMLIDVFSVRVLDGFASAVEALLPVVEQLAPTIGDVFKAIGPALATSIKAMGPGIQALADGFATILPIMAGMVVSILPSFVELFNIVAPILANLAAQIIPILANAFIQLAPIIVQLVQTALPPLVAGFLTLLPSLQQIIALLPTLLLAIMPLIPIIAEWVVKILELIPPIAELLIPIILALLPVVVRVFEAIGPIIDGALQAVRGIITMITGLMTGDWSKFWDGLTEVFKGAWNIFVGAFNTAAELFKAAVSLVWEIIRVSASFAWEAIKAAIIEPIEAAFKWVVEKVTAVWNTLTGWWNKITSIFSSPITAHVNVEGTGFVADSGGTLAPGTATGGAFDPKPGGHLIRVAEAGQQEVVMPTPWLQRIFRQSGAGGGTNSVVVHITGDGALAQLVREQARVEIVNNSALNARMLLGA